MVVCRLALIRFSNYHLESIFLPDLDLDKQTLSFARRYESAFIIYLPG